jgi:hypothetical protein
MAAPSYKAPKAYSSSYGGTIKGLLNGVANREAFTYDPMQDASYQALARVYNVNGLKAANDTMGQAAALNGGYGSSYATTAAQQVRNDYNQQLASMIPELEQRAYQRYYDNYNLNLSTANALMARDDSLYGRYRDKVADAQWLTNYNYNKWVDNRDYNYQKSRDRVEDSHWIKEYNLSKKSAASKGGSGGSGYGSSQGGGYSSGYSSGYGQDDYYVNPAAVVAAGVTNGVNAIVKNFKFGKGKKK